MPALESFSTQLLKLRAKQAELWVEINKRKAECAIIRERLQKGESDTGNAQQLRVQQILGGSPVTTAIVPNQEQLWQMQREIEDYTAAAGRVDGEIRKEIRTASIKLCESVAPEHARLAKAVATDVIALHTSYSNYLAFVDSVQDANASTSSLNIVTPTPLGNPKDLSGMFFYTLREYIDAGFLKKSDMPKALT
jgi:hypothetical protein